MFHIEPSQYLLWLAYGVLALMVSGLALTLLVIAACYVFAGFLWLLSGICYLCGYVAECLDRAGAWIRDHCNR